MRSMLKKKPDWKTLAKQALVNIYKEKLKHYCAKGSKRSKRPGIDCKVFMAVHAKQIFAFQ